MNINNHKDRILLAEETLKICEAGNYTNRKNEVVSMREQLDNCLNNTVHYTPEMLDQLSVTNNRSEKTKIEVTGETTLQAAERLFALDNSEPIFVLNFASAKNAGGGFLNGSLAQEESIARSSGLHPSLLKAPNYYATHRNSGDLLYTDNMIYSPGVPVFRSDEGNLLDNPYLISVVTSPATNKGALIQNNKPGIDRIEELMTIRAEKVLKIAAKYKYKRLILGAWGCGVFRNDPKLIATIFKKHLTNEGKFATDFAQIIFAVYDRTKELSVITPFKETFA